MPAAPLAHDHSGMTTVEVPQAAPGRPARPPSHSRLFLPALAVLAVLCVGTLVYILGDYVPPVAEDSRVPVIATWHFALLVGHIATGTVALTVGTVQFVPWIRRTHPRVHRTIGRIYFFGGVFPSSILGLPIALLSSSGPAARSGLFLMAVMWLVTAVQGYRAVRQRRYADHRRWMIRNFVLTLSALTLRAWLGLLIFVLLPGLETTYGDDFDLLFRDAYTTATWLAWVPSLLLVEWYLSRRPGLSGARPGRRRGASGPGVAHLQGRADHEKQDDSRTAEQR